MHHDVFLLSYESVSDLQVQIILAVTNVYPHAARALFRPQFGTGCFSGMTCPATFP